MNSRTWCDCLLHGELHFSNIKVSDRLVNLYLHLTNISVFVCTGQHYIFKHNATTNNGEACQVCSKKVQSFSRTIQCRDCVVKYHSKSVNVNKTEVLRKLWCCRYCAQDICSLQPFWWWWFSFCSDWRYSRLLISIAWNQQQVFTPFEIKDSFDTPFIDIDPD